MNENRLKRSLREGTLSLGALVAEIVTPTLPKLLADTGIEWVSIDLAPSGYTLETLPGLIVRFHESGLTPFVRTPDILPATLTAVMDAGALGVQIKGIESAADARRAVEAVMTAPMGKRGGDAAQNAQASIITHLETEKGLANIDEIAAVEGIDILRPGPNTAWIGTGARFEGQLPHVAEVCKRHGKAMLYHPRDDAEMQYVYGLGCRIISLSSVGLAMAAAVKAEADHVRNVVGAK